ncbi:FtsK/SpoIIIE domain-containing protein [Mycolicibacter virginiensis]|nr:FtsK/SpoIIIE domain-containing protein [Mycolicibacter virginiensis]
MIADDDEEFVFGAPQGAGAAPEPRPNREGKSASSTPTGPAEPQPEPQQGRVDQAAAIATAVDELDQLWKAAEAGPACPGPTSVEAEDHDSPAYVASLWNARFADETWCHRLFGGVAKARAVPKGTGVNIRVKVPAGYDGEAIGRRFRAAAEQAGMGTYQTQLEDPGKLWVWRSVVGEHPATPWNAAGHAAKCFYEDGPNARKSILYTAGLGVEKPKRAVPAVRSLEVGERGPEIRIRPLPGQDAEALAKLSVGKLRSIFCCPELTVTVCGADLLIALNHRPAATFPASSPLSPQLIWRPVLRSQSLLAARGGLLLPVGVDRKGNPLMIPIHKRPHTLTAGTSGAGKSTLLKLQLAALQAQGVTLLLADGKGADMREAYAAGIGHNLSVEPAAIHRAIAFVFDAMERRKRMEAAMHQRKIPIAFEPIVLCVDEFGAWASKGLSTGADKREKAGIQAAMVRINHILAQGRSRGCHLIISAQAVDAESGINTKLLTNIATRIVVGKPQGGPAGHLTKLFAEGERERVAAETAHIRLGDQGLGVVVDGDGNPTAFKGFYNAGKAAETFAAALANAPQRRRFGWKFPDDNGDWLNRTSAAFEDLEPVDSIPVIALTEADGTPIPGTERYDEGSPAYDPGSPPMNVAHAEF